jgi:hypothetical protein
VHSERRRHGTRGVSPRRTPAVTEAERKKLEADLAGRKSSWWILRPSTATPQGSAAYQQTRENFEGRIKQVRREIAYMEAKLAAK